MGKHKNKKAQKQNKTKSVLTYFASSCLHYQQPVRIGDYTILASSLIAFDRQPRGREFATKPDLLVALSTLWLGETTHIVANHVEESLPRPLCPTIIVDWLDINGLDQHSLVWLVRTILGRLERGQTVEIACHGGHGRTGTLLACLIGWVENLEPREAILEVHERYCSSAVESEGQIKCIYEFLGVDTKKVQDEWSVDYGMYWGDGYWAVSGGIHPLTEGKLQEEFNEY